MKYYLILSLVAKFNYATLTTNPLPDVRFGYCDTVLWGSQNISVCDMCGTVTQPPRYEFDIFNEDSEKIYSFTPRTTKIFGGRQVEIGEVPWQANLLYPNHFTIRWFQRLWLWIKKVLGLSYHERNQSYYTFCGGVIVSNTKVITAAHCIMSDDGSLISNDKIKVIAGHTSKITERQMSGLHKYVLHP